MINLNQYINDKKNKYHINDIRFTVDITSFIAANSWFGIKPVIENNIVYIDDNALKIIDSRINDFCRFYYKDDSARRVELESRFNNIFPITYKAFKKWAKKETLDDDIICVLIDFILYFIPGEISLATDDEMEYVMQDVFHNLPKGCADYFTDFINWLNRKYDTVYKQFYFNTKRYTLTKESEAYDEASYLLMVFRLFNPGYIEENDMYHKAASSKNYIDTWLFLSLHFISAIRNTDLIGLPHPRLTSEPEIILQDVSAGTFSDESAEAVLQTFLDTIEAFGKTPNKNKRFFGIDSYKLFIPKSVRVHFGTLLAIAEAHFRLSCNDNSSPLIRNISSYEKISRYMGEEIGDMFLEANFRSRSVNKSFMQMIDILTDDILEGDDEFNIKGYMLAALARSHKGSYAQFAQTTKVYLRDAKAHGYSIDLVTRELFERDVLSLTAVTLLRMITGGKFQNASFTNQTKMITALNMTPIEIDNAVSILQSSHKQATELASSIFNSHDKQGVVNILHNIANGNAPSKQKGSMCLMAGMRKICPFPDRKFCPGCEYEISTKSTMYVMISESDRLMALYKNTTDPIQKKRYESILLDVVLPSIDEMLTCISELYGPEALESLENEIKEYRNAS